MRFQNHAYRTLRLRPTAVRPFDFADIIGADSSLADGRRGTQRHPAVLSPRSAMEPE